MNAPLPTLTPPESPAWRAFVRCIEKELRLAQVIIFRREDGFELRHEADRLAENEKLSLRALPEMRALAQFTATGAFRPLKSAPNLAMGWRLEVAGETGLAQALNLLYPNAVADWWAAQSAAPPVTHYREFAQRQTGMYQITAQLTDTQAAQVARAGCDRKFCEKRRFWTVAGLAPDGMAEKSLLPCLEPCALLLELARQAAHWEQATKMKTELSPDDIASLQAALKIALAQPPTATREADFAAPDNPRRWRRLVEKLSALTTANAAEKNEK